jgi:phospholipid transport system transporter-binding protein
MTDSVATLKFNDGFFVIAGELNFTTVVALWDASLPLLKDAPQLNFDFTSVRNCNSAGIALMLEWVKYAKQHHKTIRFNNLPKQLKSIINVAGITAILGAAA